MVRRRVVLIGSARRRRPRRAAARQNHEPTRHPSANGPRHRETFGPCADFVAYRGCHRTCRGTNGYSHHVFLAFRSHFSKGVPDVPTTPSCQLTNGMASECFGPRGHSIDQRGESVDHGRLSRRCAARRVKKANALALVPKAVDARPTTRRLRTCPAGGCFARGCVYAFVRPALSR
jgi:hypothetical protein